MVDEREARQRFSELMARDDADIELDQAALTIAQGEYEWLDAEKYRGRLDEMAAELRPRLSPEEAAERLVAEINAYLFGEESFHGNAGNYYDPRNSYLNDVLDRRTGIPITLSLVYIEVARRAHLRIEGIGLPGHFIVRCHGSRDDLLIDTFNQGAILTIDDCAALVRELYGQSLAFTGELLRPASNREIVARILGNLKGSYLRRGDLPRALQAVEWGLIADPARADDRREKGLLRYRFEDLRGAAEDLEHYLEQRPEGVLADETRAQLRHVHQLWARRN